MPLVLLASALLGILGIVVAFRARLARRASSVRRELGAAHRFDPDAKTGARVCLDGRIRGARVTSWSGLPAEPAPRELELEVDGTLLPIRGRAAVLVGSRETVPSRGRALRTVVPNDRVRVRARIVRDAHGEGYRDGRTAAALEAFDDRGVVEIAYAGGPRPVKLGLSRYFFGSLGGTVVGVFASFGALYTYRPPPPTIVHAEPIAPRPIPTDGCAGDVDFLGGNLEAVSKWEDESTLSGKCALRRAEADIAVHRWHKASIAVHAYANGSGGAPQDLERREALECIADALAVHDDDAEPADPRTHVHGGRAMCVPLEADGMNASSRIARLGTVNWVWSDNQGMEFAKGPVVRMSKALLLEAGEDVQGTGRYGFYPDAYLARNDPGSATPYTFNDFEGGDDVLRLAWEGRRTIDALPFALFASMVSSGRPAKSDSPDFRMYVRGNLAMFLAATGDIDGARAEVENLADIPDDMSHAPYWTRPSVDSIRHAIDELAAGAAPFRMHGEIWSALESNIALARAGNPTARAAVVRLRGVLLDRKAAVPLYFLETFARR